MNNIQYSEHFLAFVDIAGKTIDGKYIYRFDFTKATDIVWGDQWNTTPAGIIPNLEPDMNCLSLTGKVETKHRYLLAKENTCFSMQDCIDGILPLLFDEPYSDELMVLPFGMPMENVISELEKHQLSIMDIKDVNEENDNEIIDNLVDSLESQTKQADNDDNDLDDEF